MIYEAPIDADWTDEAVWHQANPALGDFRSLEEMRAACARAQEIPAQEAAFRRLYLNQWTESGRRWIAMAAWDACQVPVDRAALAGRRCYVGLDLSTTTDLTAAVAVFPDDDGAGFTVLPQFFCPADAIPQRVTRDRVPYDEWARRGHLTPRRGRRSTTRPSARCCTTGTRRSRCGWWPSIRGTRRTWSRSSKQVDGFTCVKMRQGKASLSAPSQGARAGGAGAHAASTTAIRCCGGTSSNVTVDVDHAGNIQPSQGEVDRTH